MGRSSEFPVKKLIGFDQPLIDAVDEWRALQKPIPNQSEAIRAILSAWLKQNKFLSGD